MTIEKNSSKLDAEISEAQRQNRFSFNFNLVCNTVLVFGTVGFFMWVIVKVMAHYGIV